MKPKLRDRAPSTDPTTMQVEDPENMLTALVSGGSDRNRFLMEVCTFKVVISHGICLLSTCFTISQGLFCIYKQ